MRAVRFEVFEKSPSDIRLRYFPASGDFQDRALLPLPRPPILGQQRLQDRGDSIKLPFLPGRLHYLHQPYRRPAFGGTFHRGRAAFHGRAVSGGKPSAGLAPLRGAKTGVACPGVSAALRLPAIFFHRSAVATPVRLTVDPITNDDGARARPVPPDAARHAEAYTSLVRSVADDLRQKDRDLVAKLSPEERMELAHKLGERDLAIFCAAQGLERAEGIRELQCRRQVGRFPSAAMAERWK